MTMSLRSPKRLDLWPQRRAKLMIPLVCVLVQLLAGWTVAKNSGDDSQEGASVIES
jgi:hypothetical protein